MLMKWFCEASPGETENAAAQVKLSKFSGNILKWEMYFMELCGPLKLIIKLGKVDNSICNLFLIQVGTKI